MQKERIEDDFCGCATKHDTRAGERFRSWIDKAIATIEPRDSIDCGIALRMGEDTLRVYYGPNTIA